MSFLKKFGILLSIKNTIHVFDAIKINLILRTSTLIVDNNYAPQAEKITHYFILI